MHVHGLRVEDMANESTADASMNEDSDLADQGFYCGWAKTWSNNEAADCTGQVGSDSNGRFSCWQIRNKQPTCNSLAECERKCADCGSCEGVKFQQNGGGGFQCHLLKNFPSSEVDATQHSDGAGWGYKVNSRSKPCKEAEKKRKKCATAADNCDSSNCCEGKCNGASNEAACTKKALIWKKKEQCATAADKCASSKCCAGTCDGASNKAECTKKADIWNKIEEALEEAKNNGMTISCTR